MVFLVPNVGYVGIKNLMQMVYYKRNLRVLNLGYNGLKDSGAKSVAENLSRSLVELRLDQQRKQGGFQEGGGGKSKQKQY